MSKRGLLIGTCMVTIVLAFPRTGSAGLADFILEMSGPQMVGLLAQCRIAVGGAFEDCRAAPGMRIAGQGGQSRVHLTLEGGPYFSTGKNEGGQNYVFFKIGMLAFDPMLEVESVSRPGFSMYHGVLGVSYNFLFGSGVDAFTNVAFKLRPIGIAFPVGRGWKLEVEYNLRLYPNGFTADEFGKTPVVPASTTTEAVNSFSFGLRF